MTNHSPLFRRLGIAVAVLVWCASAFAQTVPLENWTLSKHFGIQSNADISNGAIFIAVTPCRVADTRNPAGTFGGPSFAPNGIRTFNIPAGPCTGILNAAAYSLNFTLVNYDASSGFVTAYPSGGIRPFVSTVNFGNGTNAVANAAVVAPNFSGAIDVYSSGATHLIIDINGYFMDNGGSMNVGRSLALLGNTDLSALIFANNTNNSVLTNGIKGLLQFNTIAGSAGVLGQVSATTGATYGVRGLSASVTANAAGVSGEATGATGLIFGVRGTTASNSANAAGVIGISGANFLSWSLFTKPGLRGINGALDGTGVHGEGGERGVMGVRVTVASGAATAVTGGVLGYLGNSGVHSFQDVTALGVKSFVEPHPTEAGRIIQYVALEGPEAGTYFRGTSRTNHGIAVIEVPDSFRIVTAEEGLTVQLTAVGGPPTMYVESEDLDRIVVRSSKDVAFHYQVNGVRKAFKYMPAIRDDIEGFFVPESAEDDMARIYPEEARRRLIANGTFNPDGTVNLATAERMGWAQKWRDAAEASKVQNPK